MGVQSRVHDPSLESLKRSFRRSVFHAPLKLKTLQHDLKHTRIKQIWQNVGELDLCDTVLRCTYVCAPGKRNFDHRRQLCRSYHFSESCLEYFAGAILVEICWNQNLGLPLDIFWLSTFFRSHSPVSYRRSSCQKRKSIGGPTARRHWQFYSECCSQSPGRMHRNPVGRWLMIGLFPMFDCPSLPTHVTVLPRYLCHWRCQVKSSIW